MKIMKNFIRLLSLVICAVTFFSLTACIGPGVTDYSEVIFGNYTFRETSAAAHKIEGDEGTVMQGVIYKYTYDTDEKYLVAHLLTMADNYGSKDALYKRLYNGSIYNVLDDNMVVYNTEDKTRAEFEKYDDFLGYCRENNIKLNNWYYPSGGLSINAQPNEITDGYTLSNLPYDYKLISLDDKELIRGYISDLEVTSHQIKFRLRQTDYHYDAEYPDTVNLGLSELSDKPVGKYKKGFLDYADIYYDKIVTIDLETGKISEE